jgi:hypothetical protein
MSGATPWDSRRCREKPIVPDRDAVNARYITPSACHYSNSCLECPGQLAEDLVLSPASHDAAEIEDCDVIERGLRFRTNRCSESAARYFAVAASLDVVLSAFARGFDFFAARFFLVLFVAFAFVFVPVPVSAVDIPWLLAFALPAA